MNKNKPVMRFNAALAATVLLFLGLTECMAQSTGNLESFPGRPVRIIVTSAAGASADMLTRAVANRLSQLWSQPVVVENIAGASGNVGLKRAASAEPTGHTIVTSGSSMTLNAVVNATFYKDLGFDPEKAFVAITQAVANPQILVSRPGLGTKNFAEYIALARKKDGGLLFGHSGFGAISHIAHELIAYQTGIKFTSVPYKSGAFSMNALLGDHVDAIIITLATASTHVRTGRLTGLAVTTKDRSKTLPDVPTLAECGLKGYDLSSWQGYFVPVKTPGPIVERLYRDMATALKTPEVHKFLDDLGYNVTATTPAETHKLMRDEINRFRQIVKAANITVGQ